MGSKKVPGKIRKLEETVVNKIAAGEVIQRPANALKELLENSLDAGASNIQITVKNGGLKVLQIQDDGSGIREEDLPILCERFTTSKLRQFEDLKSIATYGFRGEALSSVSHVSHLTIITKTVNSPCAFKAEYIDGRLKPSGPKFSNPRAYAGTQGTTILVEDLFYNMDTRKRSLRSPQEEYNKVAEVITRYAVHNSGVGFSLKKQGETSPDLRTPSKSTVVDNVAILYGSTISKELLHITCEETKAGCKINGYITNVNFSTKKPAFLLFINHRLVESTSLKRSIDTIYGAYLPKGSYPFVYLSLELDPQYVDVNVSPTKHEVHFLHEDLIISALSRTVENCLLSSNESRTFVTKSLLPNNSAGSSAFITNKNNNKRKEDRSSSSSSTTIRPKDLVRTDPKSQKLDRFVTITPKTIGEDGSLEKQPIQSSSTTSTTVVNKREFNITSVINMRKSIYKDCHNELMEIIRNHTFVGCVDNTFALIQHDTKMYLVNTWQLSAELFYQKMVQEFGNMGRIELIDENTEKNMTIRELMEFWLSLPCSEEIWTNYKAECGDAEISKEELAVQIQNTLLARATMLDDYFAISFDPTGVLQTIPLILDNYVPNIENIGKYLINLALKVNWKEEQECFEGVCQQTANFYAIQPGGEELNREISQNGHSWKWTIEHVIFTELKKTLLPPRAFINDKTLIALTSLPDLYKVFERC